jgi:thioredoxin-dependent peroxiredoxin
MLGVMLHIGDPVPPLSAKSTTGPVSLEALRGKIVVIYFFRKAFTRNCTVETKGFRDNYEELRALGAEVIGVSCDELPRQCEFATAQSVSFPMIADPERTISHAYDVLLPIIPISHRVTYVLDRDHKIAGRFKHEFAVLRHLDEVMHFVRQLAKSYE